MSNEGEIKRMLAKILLADINEVVPEAELINDLGADSLNFVEITMMIKQKFNIDIDDETAEKMITVKDVIDSVKQVEL